MEARRRSPLTEDELEGGEHKGKPPSTLSSVVSTQAQRMFSFDSFGGNSSNSFCSSPVRRTCAMTMLTIFGLLAMITFGQMILGNDVSLMQGGGFSFATSMTQRARNFAIGTTSSSSSSSSEGVSESTSTSESVEGEDGSSSESISGGENVDSSESESGADGESSASESTAGEGESDESKDGSEADDDSSSLAA